MNTTRLSFDPSLPIAREADRIVELIRRHPVVVVAGETGSGKTTQLPKLCLAAGRGGTGRMIGCTQPRRIAARAVARRVAEELGTELGGLVGFQVRFADQVSEHTRIKFMTDGILLAETASDRLLSAYDTLIVDEAHERSLNIDFLLGYLKQLLVRRPDLKLVVTSATIDTARFARHFNDAPVVSVEGRTYPVGLRYRPIEPDEAADHARPGPGSGSSAGTGGSRTSRDGDPVTRAIVAGVEEITREDPIGDVLVFLPGEREIRDAHQALEQRKYRSTEVVPLYARLSARDQDRVFRPGPGRRIVLATNVAETSLTVPRIRYVVDPGLARVKRYSSRQKLDRLHIEPVSRASADQRKGRCGRVSEGICYRLYSEADFASRPEFTDPEIRRSSLAGVILRMLSLRLGQVEDFPFLEPPEARAIADGWQQLAELGAVDGERRLTQVGRQMARLPVDPKLARMLVAARQHGCLAEMTVIAAFLGIQDPRERPPDAREAADRAHALFADPRSEFVGVLRLWDAYREAHEALTQSKLRQWCERHFLGFLRMREWRELHRQLLLLCRELAWPLASVAGGGGAAAVQVDAAVAGGEAAQAPFLPPAGYAALHRALIAGLPGQIGHRTDKGDYEAPRQRRFRLFPGSTLAKKAPPWVLSANLLDLGIKPRGRAAEREGRGRDTTGVWAMVNAAIEPDWAIAELPHLVARRYSDPHWSRARGQVMAAEQISLFGLVLAPRRPVHYGRIAPDEARELFVRQGLVTGEIDTRVDFLAANLATLEQARIEEAKLRRSGVVADEDWQAQWYLQRIPQDMHSTVALEAWYRRGGGAGSGAATQASPTSDAASLHWSLDDLLPGQASDDARYPAHLKLGEVELPLHYRFEPGAADDGVTLALPLHLLNALEPARLSWLAPGFVADKAAALIRSLPKAQRRNYVPAPDFARAFAEAHPHPAATSLEEALARFLARATGAPVAAQDFEPEGLEPHLRMNLRLSEAGRDGKPGRVLAESRDLEALRTRYSGRAGQAFSVRAGRRLAAERLETFPSEAIPERVPGEAGVPAYPALVAVGPDEAALRMFADASEAGAAHPGGVRRLMERALADRIRQACKQLPVSSKTGLLYASIESQERLRGDIVEAALNALLDTGLDAIRSQADFEHRRDEVGRRLFPEAVERLALAERILAALGALRPMLTSPTGVKGAAGNDLRTQLAAMVRPGFLRETPADALAQFPRYLKAMTVRAERAPRDPGRDQARMQTLQPLLDAVAQARTPPPATAAAWEALRWDIEELRVSLFAQELGARTGTSAKKLEQRVQQLQQAARTSRAGR